MSLSARLSTPLGLSLTALLAACSGAGTDSATEQVGRLADLRIQGLTYATLTRTGETDEEGRFRYLPGEDVAFYLGTVLIGMGSGRPTLSLFDLTGAPMPTANHQIARSLERDPAYRRLANANQLLQALDLDANSANGIRLTEEVVELFSGAQIDLEQDVELFGHDAVVRGRLAAANERGLLGEARELPPTVQALGRLYRALHVDEAGFARRRTARDTDLDGWLDDSSERTYDPDGNLHLCLHDLDGDGAPEFLTERIRDAHGVRIETRSGLDAAPSSVVQLGRDAQGNQASYRDDDGDGHIDAAHLMLADSRGRTVLEAHYGNDDPGRLELLVYGPQGRRIRSAAYGDLKGLAVQLEASGIDANVPAAELVASILAAVTPDSSHRFRYDAEGREVEQAYDRDGDDPPDSYVYQSFDAQGRLSRREQDNDGDGSIDSLTLAYHDAAGNRIRTETDADADGDLDLVSWAEYDAAGNLLRRVRDDHADGAADEITTWEYDVHGNPVTRRDDYDGDGLNDSVTHTYWVPGVWNTALETATSIRSCLDVEHL